MKIVDRIETYQEEENRQQPQQQQPLAVPAAVADAGEGVYGRGCAREYAHGILVKCRPSAAVPLTIRHKTT